MEENGKGVLLQPSIAKEKRSVGLFGEICMTRAIARDQLSHSLPIADFLVWAGMSEF